MLANLEFYFIIRHISKIKYFQEEKKSGKIQILRDEINIISEFIIL